MNDCSLLTFTFHSNQSTNIFNEMYNDRLKETGHIASSTYDLAFDAVWTLGQALNYTEQMRLQILTVNGTLSQSNCSNCDGIHSTDSADSFIETLEMCSNLEVLEMENTTFDDNCTDMLSQMNSTIDLATVKNCTGVIRAIQNCMVEKLAEVTNCTDLYGELVPLNDFNYSNAFMGCVIRYNFQRTDFLGISVSVA